MKHCDNISDEFVGSRVGMIQELNMHLEETSFDSQQWVTKYKCKLCGQEWEEVYIASGHGEYPTVRKTHGTKTQTS